jgi:hypothetical protein
VPPPDYRDLVRSYLDLRWQIDPVAATQAGAEGHDARLGEFSKPQVKAAIAALKSMAAAFEYCETTTLDEEVDQTAVLNDLRTSIARLEKERPHELNPEFHLTHLFDGLFVLLARNERPVEERGRALTGRLLQTPRFLREARQTLGRPPKVFCQTALAVANGGRVLLQEAIPAFAAGLSAAARPALHEAVEAARAELDEFIAFLGGELADRADGDFAIGRARFDFRLHYGHALRETAPELLRYGEALVRDAECDLEQRADCGGPIPPAASWWPRTPGRWSGREASWPSAAW